jgi:hypothetical protein
MQLAITHQLRRRGMALAGTHSNWLASGLSEANDEICYLG